MKTKQIPFIALLIILSNQSYAKKNLSAHEHGSATISIAYEKNSAEIELESPADSILGFEHAAKSEKEKKIFENAKNLWNKLESELVIFPKELNCKVSQSDFRQVLGNDDHHEDKKHHHEKNHHGDESTHSEIEASATISCEKAITGNVNLTFKKHFKKMKNVKVEIVGAKSQTKKLQKESEVINL